MQHNILTTMRSLKMMEGCKGTQVFALDPSGTAAAAGGGVGSVGEKFLHHLQEHLKVNSIRAKSTRNFQSNNVQINNTTVLAEALAAYGLPQSDLLEPQIEPCLKSVNFVETLADLYRRIENCPQFEKSGLYLEQCATFRGLSDPKLFRRSLQSARLHAVNVHSKIVLSAWLRFERREDELIGTSSMDCCGRNIECPKASLVSGYSPESVYDPCTCFRSPREDTIEDSDAEFSMGDDECSTSEEDGDTSFCIGDDEVRCIRYNIASLSRPFKAMLYGGFLESQREKINFSQIGISIEGMRAAEIFSRTRSVDSFNPDVVLEILSLANKFCCDDMKSACDAYLASLVYDMERAMLLIDYGLDETAPLLVAACLQVFMRELPSSIHNPSVMRFFCSTEARERLDLAGHASFLLYYFLSQIAMEVDMKANTTVMLLERLGECANEHWQKQIAFHQLGCVMLERKEYKDAQKWFEAAVEAGHVYSLVGVARTKYKRGHMYSAYKMMNSLISDYSPAGWMYQERSLYCSGEEKMMDLDTATELDPTLSYRYKYRAVMMMEENKIGEAISEINRIIGFKVSPDCLELRAWFSISMEDYEGALRDVRAILTLDPNYMMFHGKLHGDHLVELLRHHVQQWSQADCWMQLYDRWSCVDDIGSLAVVHHMLANDPGKSLLRFRQSLLLLRLNCQKAAMHSLRLARNHSTSEHERLVYEGWILYDTGHREEALAKAEESISIQRSFEAFFLKAYALADSNLDNESSLYVIELLEEALRCPSDGLRKGQALNNLGSVYVDCDKLDLAADCYMNALNIKHTRAHQGLARVYHLKNQRKAAYDEMTKLIEKAQNNASAYEKRSEYCDRDMAKSDLSMATQLDPLRTYPYRYRAAGMLRPLIVSMCPKRTKGSSLPLTCDLLRYRSMEEQEEKAMDTKGLRKLDYNAPLLSTRRPSGATNLQLSRTNSQGAWRDTSNRVPFSWEQTAGKPKDSEANDNHAMGVVPPPKLPPGRWHPPKANQCHGDDDDGCDGDIDDEDDVFSDAIDLFSLSESIDMPEAFNNVNGLASLNSEIEECNSALSPSFIIQRFLTDANALAESSSALAHSEILNKKLPDGYVSPAVRQSYSAPQGCGFDIFFPWRMKHKPCGIKSPVRQPSLNVKPQWGSKRKQKH